MIRVAATSKVPEEGPFIPENFRNPLWDDRRDYSAVLECMQKGDLIYTCEMKVFLERKNKEAKFNNEVHYGILKHGNSYVAIAYKPKGPSDISSAHAEKVAYDVYEKAIAPHTGHHFVPPTIVRTMPDGRETCCQFFVETDDQEDMWKYEFRERVFAKASPEVVQEIALFNAVFNDWDCHPGNYLATQREGHLYFARIDNESIENKGWLLKWGDRSYIPAFFSDDARAQVQKEIHLAQDITLDGFKSIVLEHGFAEVPRIRVIFNNLCQRGEGNRVCLIRDGVLSVCYHQGNQSAFPLPKAPYSPVLVDTYRRLTKEVLDPCFQPLVQLDPKRFGTRVADILQRRDMFLSAVSS
jgi:hypothetical protein